MFGMLTGTASTGMILLREIDPNFETPAADNLVMQQVPAIAFGAPILLLMSFAAESVTNSWIVFGIMVVLFVIYNMITLRKLIFKKKDK
jgi:ESS family glutamate:Na+ symporter